MTQEYTGKEFRAPYCEALAKGPVEWKTLYDPDYPVWEKGVGLPRFDANQRYRFKPTPKRMVTMYDKHGKPHLLVAPEREAPEVGTNYFFICEVPSINECVRDARWDPHKFDFDRLRYNNVFLTIEDAQAMADFQREQREGA